MIIAKRVVLLAFVFVLFFASSVSAIGVTAVEIDSTHQKVTVSSATNLYGYEVAFDYTSTASLDSPSLGFLSSGTAFGSSKRNSIFSVYESKQDGTTTGISGSGDLFNVTYSGTLTLRYLLAVYGDGTSEYVYYNNSASNITSGGSTGGGGGSSSTSTSTGGAAEPRVDPTTVKLSASPLFEDVVVTALINQESERNVTVTTEGNSAVTLQFKEIGLPLGILDLPGEITLQPGESYVINLVFKPSERGLLTGKLIVTVNNQDSVKEFPIILNVRSANFLFDSVVSLAESYKIITPGKPLVANIDLAQVGRVGEQVDVTANYIIKDFAGTTHLEESETFSVLGSKSYTKDFATGSLPAGKYVLGLEIVYPGAFATSSTQFEIRPRSAGEVLILAVAGFVIFAVVVGGMWWALRKHRNIAQPNLGHLMHRTSRR